MVWRRVSSHPACNYHSARIVYLLVQARKPAKILPDIDKWGAGTMKAYLEGFTSLDIKSAFDTVGAIETILRSDVAAGKGDEQGACWSHSW